MEPLSRLSNEPRWRPPGQVPRSSVPAGLWEWLLNGSSLTRRLQSRCEGRFLVHLLQQNYRTPGRTESRILGLGARRGALVRQVRLVCDGTPWVFARTVIPPQTLHGAGRGLAHLGTRPLGAVLFADPSIRRTNLEIAQITQDMPLYARVFHTAVGDEPIWGRRSRFLLRGRPLLVSEIFLPAFCRREEIQCR